MCFINSSDDILAVDEMQNITDRTANDLQFNVGSEPHVWQILFVSCGNIVRVNT